MKKFAIFIFPFRYYFAKAAGYPIGHSSLGIFVDHGGIANFCRRKNPVVFKFDAKLK